MLDALTNRRTHPFVMVSSKLRITLATMEYAASSATASRSFRGDSPTDNSSSAAFWFWATRSCARQATAESPGVETSAR